jgi:hypothetical protein
MKRPWQLVAEVGSSAHAWKATEMVDRLNDRAKSCPSDANRSDDLLGSELILAADC